MTIQRIVRPSEDLSGVGEGLLPPVPSRSNGQLATLRKLGAIPRAVEIDVSYLHLAAHVCLYGSVPDDVHLSVLLFERAPGRVEPRIYMMCASDSARSLEWVEAARAGMDHWREAGFDDPLAEIQEQAGTHTPVFSSYDTLLQHNLNRLKIHGSLDGYLRLKRHSYRPPAG